MSTEGPNDGDHDDGKAEAEAALGRPLRYGWTTGACATAATKAAATALLTGNFPDPVTIRLPKGDEPAFALAHEAAGPGYAEAGIIKDAGDDPDVTHGALIIVRVARGAPGSGVTFKAGEGVGTVTKPGLPIPPGEPAINPVPREMMRGVIAELGGLPDATIEIRVPGGEVMAKHTWNPRLGIIGGISILGTTGVVVPYSCSAWIHSIHRGIDVARAMGLAHVAGSVGDASEQLARRTHNLSDNALIDMGDFVGGMLKYLRAHPVPRVTIAGGFAKMAKLAQGAMDLHSGRSQLDKAFLAGELKALGASDDLVSRAAVANSGLEICELASAAGLPLAGRVAELALVQARRILKDDTVVIDVLVTDRLGNLIGRAS